MWAKARVVLRTSIGVEIHTVTGRAEIPAHATHTLSGTGTIANEIAVNADHWTIDVTWNLDGPGSSPELPAMREEAQPAATPEPSMPAPVAADSQPFASPQPAATPAPEVAETPSVSLSVDLAAEQATITNTGRTDINLRGWELVSITGDQRMKFVIGQLPAGGRMIVTSGARARTTPGYYLWTTRSIWDINGDAAELYDPQGNLRARTNADGSRRR